MKLVLTIVAILLIAGFAQASTLTVCSSGCDYTSIQTAVYAAHPNDTIEVQSGTYNESIILTKDISLFKGTDTGIGEPIVNGDLYKNDFNSALRGFSFQSINSGIPYTKDMTTPNTTIYWIEKAFENPSTPKAIAELNRILKTNPNDSWGWYRLGWALSNAQRYEESMNAYNESSKLDPYFSFPWSGIGNSLYSLGKYDQASEAYDESIKLLPTATNWNSKGNALYREGKYEEAIKAYDEAIRLDPEYAPAWDDKGNTLNKLGRTTEAHEAFANAEELGYYES